METNEKLVIISSGQYYGITDGDRRPLLVVDDWDGTQEQVRLIMAWYIAMHPGYRMSDLDWASVEYASFATTPEEIEAN